MHRHTAAAGLTVSVKNAQCPPAWVSRPLSLSSPCSFEWMSSMEWFLRGCSVLDSLDSSSTSHFCDSRLNTAAPLAKGTCNSKAGMTFLHSGCLHLQGLQGSLTAWKAAACHTSVTADHTRLRHWRRAPATEQDHKMYCSATLVSSTEMAALVLRDNSEACMHVVTDSHADVLHHQRWAVAPRSGLKIITAKAASFHL